MKRGLKKSAPASYAANGDGGAWLTDDAWLQMRRQYETMRLSMEAAEQTAEKLIKLDEERRRLFEVLNEQFDILFAENEDLAATLVIRENRILELEKQLARTKKTPRKQSRPVSDE